MRLEISIKCIWELLLAREEKVLQGVIDRLIEIGRRYGMEMNVGKNEGNENLKTTIPYENYDGSKAIGEYGIFQLFG
jgi:hypothetical protein